MKKIAIVYGEYNTALQKKAVELLSKILLDYTFMYPVCVSVDEKRDLSDYIKIYIGTKENNSYIKANSLISFTDEEGYHIKVTSSEVIIEGASDAGVLYGCVDFYNKYLLKNEYTDDSDNYFLNPFEVQLKPFELSSSPDVKNRGIWTWGHVVYDYKRFIDNMLMLKMNTIVIWNDDVPINAKDLIEYAHSSGIKVIWGYSWFWDTNCNLVDFNTLNEGIDKIIDEYEKCYHHLGGDGIYFQSFTELDSEYIGDKLIAQVVTDVVNTTAQRLLEKYPDLELQFGLHATSVKEKLEYIEKIDKRIRIVWENCGAFPFSYIPKDVDDFEETVAFTRKISKLRGSDDKFGAVLKGITKLDWGDFEHTDGRLFIGTSSDKMKENKILRKNKIWRYLQAYWFKNADKAQKMVEIMQEEKCGDLYITALIEDGMFEENIIFPAAMISEIMWDSKSDIRDMITDVALRSYVTFA